MVTSLLTRYVPQRLEKVQEKGDDAGFKKAQIILATLGTRWSADEEAKSILNRFEHKPDRLASYIPFSKYSLAKLR
jgi:hypothetical protein